MDPCISAVLIVRNEQAHLPACLEALAPVVDEIVVVDTGSTDRTIEIARAYTERVFHFAWVNNFAAARNAAIAHATGDWVLSVDADECIQGGQEAAAKLRAFAQGHTSLTVGTLAIHSLDDGTGVFEETIDHIERYFHRAHFRYDGAIHEQLVPLAGEKCVENTGLHALHTGYAHRHDDPAHKSRRNIPLLVAELAKRPDDEYLYCQLGKAHYALKEYALAAHAYEAALSRMRFSGSALPQGREGNVPRIVLTGGLVNLAYAYINLGRAEDARRLLDEHAALAHPGAQWADFAHAHGYVFLMLGDVAASRKAYEASIVFGPAREDVLGTGSFASLYHLGLLDEAEQRPADAAQHYAAALSLRSGYRPAISRALDWILEGQPALAREVMQHADPQALQSLGVERVQKSLQNGNASQAALLQAFLSSPPVTTS